MPRWLRRLAPVLMFVLSVAAVGAASAPRVTFTDTRLRNGLRVIVSEDHSAPVFSLAVTYIAGSRDERKGRTGFAHLFEHMMFKGSEQVGPGEHFTLIFNNGGSMNGTTNQDRTLYYETLPANQLDLALFLEADRMWSLDITAANLENQRNAVQEERRLGVDNQAYGRTFEVIGELAFDNFANKHSVIGSMADLSAATVDDVKSFFRTYYAPNNAVLTVVGAVRSGDVLARARKHFERIPSQPAPPKPDLKEPPQTAERRQTLDDKLARLSRVDIVWHSAPSNTPDEDAMNVLASVLAGGRSSRFYESLVRQAQLTTGVNAFNDSTRGPNLFRVSSNAQTGKSIADLEAGIHAQIEKVKTGEIAPWEIEKAINTEKRAFASGLANSLQRAVLLGEFAAFWDDPNLINTYVDRLAKVTAADVQRVAKQFLVATNRTVVITNPKPTTSPASSNEERQR